MRAGTTLESRLAVHSAHSIQFSLPSSLPCGLPALQTATSTLYLSTIPPMLSPSPFVGPVHEHRASGFSPIRLDGTPRSIETACVPMFWTVGYPEESRF